MQIIIRSIANGYLVINPPDCHAEDCDCIPEELYCEDMVAVGTAIDAIVKKEKEPIS